MPSLVFTDRAQEDLLEAWLYMADDDLVIADRVVDTIEQESRIREDQPWIGRARPELGRQLRSWPTSTPYILFYTVAELEVTVLRVLHHARDVRLAAF